MTPLYAGCNSVQGLPETQFEPAHLGLRAEETDGTRTLYLPVALAIACQKHRISHLLDPHFPEIHGRHAFPFHTKARRLLRSLIANDQRRDIKLSRPLENAICFDVPESVIRWVEARLHSYAGWRGRKLCIIGRSGYTSVGKNWGHRWREDLPPGQRVEGQECRDLMKLMLKRDPNWLFLTCEDRLASGDNSIRDPQMNCVSYAELVGSRDQSALPYGWIMRALMNLAELVVGVPSGPYHLAMVKQGLPVVGSGLSIFRAGMMNPRRNPPISSAAISPTGVRSGSPELSARPEGWSSERGGFKAASYRARAHLKLPPLYWASAFNEGERDGFPTARGKATPDSAPMCLL